jgi:hypothetical protein
MLQAGKREENPREKENAERLPSQTSGSKRSSSTKEGCYSTVEHVEKCPGLNTKYRI